MFDKGIAQGIVRYIYTLHMHVLRFYCLIWLHIIFEYYM